MDPQPMAADEETRHPVVPADGQAPSDGTTCRGDWSHSEYARTDGIASFSVPLDDQQRARRAEYEGYILQHEKDVFQIGYFLRKISRRSSTEMKHIAPLRRTARISCICRSAGYTN